MTKNDYCAKIIDMTRLPDSLATAFVRGIDVLEDPSMPRRETIMKRVRGVHRTYVSQNFSNFTLDWGRSLRETIAAVGGLVVGGLKGPAAGILAALQAYKAIIGVLTVDLTGDHASLVDILWIEFKPENPVADPRVLDAADKNGITSTRVESALKDLNELWLVRTLAADNTRSHEKLDYLQVV